MADNIDNIKKAAGPYTKETLEARKMFIDLRLRQDPEIRSIFLRAIDRIGDELKKNVSLSRIQQIKNFLTQVKQDKGIINDELTKKISEYHLAGAEAGSYANKAISVKLFETAVGLVPADD